MNRIEKGSISALVIQIVAFVIVAIILWPILDLLYCAIISHSEFVYSVDTHLVKPMVFGCIVGLVFWVVDKVSVKKNGQEKRK